MTVTIGRIGLSGEAREPSQISFNGDQLSMSGVVKDLTSDQWKALQDQFRGLQNPDEYAIPITSTSNPTLDGFYTLDQAPQVTADPDGYPQGSRTGWFRWSLNATRVTAAASPLVESVAIMGNWNGETSTTAAFGTPPGSLDFGDFDNHGWNHWTTRTTPDGVADLYVPQGASHDVATYVMGYVPDATKWYQSSAALEFKYGSTWETVQGRQVPPFTAGGTYGPKLAGNWRLGNGLVRISNTSDSSSALLLEVFDSGSWQTCVTLGLSDASESIRNFTSLTVSRNQPGLASVTLGMVWPASGAGVDWAQSQFLSLSVARAQRYVTMNWQNAVNLAPKITFTGETGTTTGLDSRGIMRSADDTHGNRWMAVGTTALTYHTAADAYVLHSGSAGLMINMVGALNGSTGTGPDDLTAGEFPIASSIISDSVSFAAR